MRLLLVPHAETDWSAQQRYTGHADVPLNPRGKLQATCLARRLGAELIDRAYTSDLKRARETAAAIGESCGFEAVVEPRLRELGVGAWEGLTSGEVQLRHPEALAAWMTDGLHQGPPGGESLTQLAGRLREFLGEIVRESGEANRSVLLVAHRGSLRVLVCLALGLEPRSHWRFRLTPASLSELELHDGAAVLTSLNDTHHLREVAHAG